MGRVSASGELVVTLKAFLCLVFWFICGLPWLQEVPLTPHTNGQEHVF